jgi:2,3-bisphosphoglycerate-independent phosphoglycerate mutase
MANTKTNRAMLIILDGFGNGKDSPYNAVKNAKMPFYRELYNSNPHSQLTTHGEAVGLPEGVMGNSEVGHQTLGAGRIIYQDLTRINRSIRDKSFFKNETIRKTIEAGKKATGRVHFMGLLSDGGVHSHIDHLKALLDLAIEMEVPHVSVHAFMDGRDTPPTSGETYMADLLKHPAFQGKGKTKAEIGIISGRYWIMDRDKRWERVEKGYKAITGQIAETKLDPVAALKKSYAAEKGDEFVEPVLLSKAAAMKDGDSVFFFNYRSDRAREISTALTAQDFKDFDRGKAPKLSAYASMTVYDKNFTFPAAFPPQSLENIFGEWLEKKNLTQFRTAETEKYAHVTFFFNGGREAPFKNEERVLIPSPKEVATYDLKPEMSATEVCASTVQKIKEKQYDFVLINFANPDMVGHTGNYEAVIKALETLDGCLMQLITTARDLDYNILLTADHGNADQMRADNGEPHTQHTLNPVPITWIAARNFAMPKGWKRELHDGSLQDVMPTLCDLMNLDCPKEATGKSLIAKA